MNFNFGVLDIIFFILLVLKLCGLFDHSWWIVFAPLVAAYALAMPDVWPEILEIWKQASEVKK